MRRWIDGVKKKSIKPIIEVVAESDELQEIINTRLEKLNQLMDDLNKKIAKPISNPQIYADYLKQRIDFMEWTNKKYNLSFKGMPNKIFQREIFYCELGYNLGSEQNEKRPVVILQNNLGNKFGNTTIIAPITTYDNSTFEKIEGNWYIKFLKSGKEESKKLDFYEIPVEVEDKVNIIGAVNVVHMREVSKKRLSAHPIAKITEDNLKEIQKAIIKNLSTI